MKKIILFLFAFFILSCGLDRHHMSLNDKNGFDTTYNPSKQELRIVGLNEPFALFFFTTSCGYCEKQIEIFNDFLANNNLKIIGILGDTNGFDKDLELLSKKNITFTTTSDPRSVKYFSDIVGGISGTPVTFLFDKNGKIAKRFLGLYPKSAFENELKILSN